MHVFIVAFTIYYYEIPNLYDVIIILVYKCLYKIIRIIIITKIEYVMYLIKARDLILTKHP